MVWHRLRCDSAATYRFDTLNLYGCDSIVLLHLTVLEPPIVVAHSEYDCAQRWYHLTAVTDARYVTWCAQPADSAGLLLLPPDAYAQPMTTVAYIVCADLRDTLFCPAYDTLLLKPALLPAATIVTRPEMLTENSLTLYAEAHSHYARRLQWFVDRRWYADDRANITYVADPLADSVLLTVVVENDLCADTVAHTVPVYHEALHIPNIFLPEGDDAELRLFRVRSNAVTDFEMDIYNRSGDLVFHATDIDAAWDGTYRGVPCPQGAYVYYIRYRVPSLTKNRKSLVGTVTLVR